MHPHAPDFNQAPFILIWEVTQGCALACHHCRAKAIDWRHPDELTTDEGKLLIDQVAAMGTSILVFSGGDPLQRDDLETLIAQAKSRGLRTGTIPAATERLTAERVQRLKAAGLDQMALSLDGADAKSHDAFRGVPGSFDRTMAGARYARNAGLPLQINTVFAAWNADQFDALAERVTELGIVFWEVFFLVPIGRGALLEELSPEQFEDIFAKLYALQKKASFIVKVTEAPHYRRYVVEQEKHRSRTEKAKAKTPTGLRVRKLLAREIGPHGSLGQAPRGVNSGKGFMFVSHTGDMYPSGFLPIAAGNVRHTSPGEIYRDSPIFKELRDPSRLKGRCGRCEYRDLCGGSRARAYALTRDYLAEDSSCLHQPAGGFKIHKIQSSASRP